MSFTIIVFLLIVINGNRCLIMDDEEMIKSAVVQIPSKTINDENEAIKRRIERVETIGDAAEKIKKDGILPIEGTEELYDEMVHIANDIIESMRDVNNAYKFLNVNGIQRVVSSNLMLSHPELRKRLLILIYTLFKVAPVTTNSQIPTSVVDRLLDIFENDENLALKARALDILNVWLPNNPMVQARVMKVKGLEPFYRQVTKLDISVIRTLLELFNTILNEHIQARNEKVQKTKADLDRLRLYQRIGFIERVSSSTVCNGLLNIFEIAWESNTKDKNTLVSLFDVIKNIKPFCIHIYKRKAKAIRFFQVLSEYVTNLEKLHLMDDDLHLTEIQPIIEDYMENLKLTARDEF